MAGLIPDDVVTNAQQLFQLHHESFAVEDIVVFQKSKPVVNSTDSNYNMLFKGNESSEDITYETVSGVYKARVRFPENQDTTIFGTKQDRRSEDQLNVKLKAGMIRVIVDPTGAAAIRTAERIVHKSKIYEISSDEGPLGFQKAQFFTFFLKQLN
jgi:hypothetical protein